MPQIYAKVAPRIQSCLTLGALALLDTELTRVVEEVFGLQGENDVAFSAENLVYIRGEALLQLEIRFTAGEDEYGKGEPFDPSRELKEQLANKLKKVAEQFLVRCYSGYTIPLTVSVWVQPKKESVFVI